MLRIGLDHWAIVGLRDFQSKRENAHCGGHFIALWNRSFELKAIIPFSTRVSVYHSSFVLNKPTEIKLSFLHMKPLRK